MMRTRTIGSMAVALLVVSSAGQTQEANVSVPMKATADGNYSGLLRTIKVPEDETTYGKFYDFGYYAGAEYAGYEDLVSGYWVYLAPNWYIWRTSSALSGQGSTIDGPEARDIIGRITGYVVIAKESRQIIALSLPTMRQTVVRRDGNDGADFYPTIHALSGPDSDGRIAYIEDHFFVETEEDEKHVLKTIKLDGTADTTIYSRPGSAMWATTRAGHGEIGSHLALSPFGGKVALLSAVEEKQMPRALLSIGRVEVWDVANRRPLVVNAKALDQPMSWFPDGKRLAYARLVPRDELPRAALGIVEFGKYAGQLWNEVPAVYILDTQTGHSTFLHVGWTPIVSLDGRTVLVGGWDNRMDFTWRGVNVASGGSEPVCWPGDAQGAIAVPAENIVVYWGLPTTGAPIRYTERNSRLSGPKLLLDVKAAVIGSTEFQTVVPELDPRTLVSFGRAKSS